MRSNSPDPEARTYSTGEVVIATETSLREIQWWDEHGLVCPAHFGHQRHYTEWEVVEIALIKHMRARHISLKIIRSVLGKWRRTGNIERARFIILGLAAKQIQTTDDELVAIKILRDTRSSAWLIDAGEKGRMTRATLAQGLQRTDSGRRYADPIGRAGFPTKGAGSSRLPAC